MARKLSCLLAAATAVGVTASSGVNAQTPASVAYDVTFEEVTNNCPDQAMSLDRGTVRLVKKRGNKIAVEIPDAPRLDGTRGKAGKFKAEGAGPAAIAGTNGKFSVAGRADRERIQLSFIAELYRGKKPLCTQSWAAAGKRKD